jgi:hypothetical protein
MSDNIHAANMAARDAANYLAMCWMRELDGKPHGWPMGLAVERLTEAANALGFVMVPVASRTVTLAPDADKTEAA